MCTNEPVRDAHANHHARSTLDQTNNTLTLRINCFVETVSTFVDRPPGVAGTVTYNCEPTVAGPTGTIANFQRSFRQSIENHWHNKLWIWTALPDPNIQPLQCGVEVTFVSSQSQSHCHITLLLDPRPAAGQQDVGFRPFCHRAGVSNVAISDMVIWYPALNGGAASDLESQFRATTSDQGEQPFEQNFAAHEFGHYLGLRHRCFSPGTANADADYCIGLRRELMENVMSVGNTLNGSSALPWATRLRRHHYHCDRTWVGHTSRPVHHANLSSSLAGP